MRRKKRSLLFLVLSILSWIGFLYIFFAVSPDSHIYLFKSLSVKQISNISLPAVPLFLALLFTAVTSTVTLVVSNLRRGILLGAFVVAYGILRLVHAESIFYVIILLLVFLGLELFFIHR